MKNFFLVFYTFSSCTLLIIAHPFYKTMPSEYEPIYQELKDLEQLVIEMAKKEYPSIPNEHWEQFAILEQEFQKNIRDDNVIFEKPKKSLLKHLLLAIRKKREKYQEYYIHECKRLGINLEKINFELKPLDYNTLGTTKGPFFKVSGEYNLQSKKPYVNIFLDIERKPIITVDADKSDFDIHSHNTIKHELIHVCEIHYTKLTLLQQLIILYRPYPYDETTFEKIINEYLKIIELQATIIPALLESNYHLTLAEITPIDYKSRTNIDPNGDVIHFWLQKIEIANVKPPFEKTYFLPNFLKKLYALIAFLKKQIQ